MQRQLEQIIVAATLAFLLGCHAGPRCRWQRHNKNTNQYLPRTTTLLQPFGGSP